MEISGKALVDNTATDSHSVSLAKKKIEATEVLGACGANGSKATTTAAAARRRRQHPRRRGGGDAHTDQWTKPAKL